MHTRPKVAWDAKDFGFHTFRRSGASLAFSLNVPVQNIKAHGIWSSDAVYSYFQPLKIWVWAYYYFFCICLNQIYVRFYVLVLLILCFSIRFYVLTCYCIIIKCQYVFMNCFITAAHSNMGCCMTLTSSLTFPKKQFYCFSSRKLITTK